MSNNAPKENAPAIARPELTCYAIHPHPPQIVPGRPDRHWMDATHQRFAYRCIPLSIANASGWEILCPSGFEASWFGGPRLEDIAITSRSGKAPPFVASHFGHGVLTFHTGYLFRTSPGWALWCRGPPNVAKRNFLALDGLVETDWLPFPFTMNWRFTRPCTVRFEEGEPFCFITLAPHALLDAVEPVVRPLDGAPEIKAAYEAWGQSRADFNARLARREVDAVAEQWQRHYVRGAGPHGRAGGFHLSRRKLKPPKIET